jgi:hypothetical protein
MKFTTWREAVVGAMIPGPERLNSRMIWYLLLYYMAFAIVRLRQGPLIKSRFGFLPPLACTLAKAAPIFKKIKEKKNQIHREISFLLPKQHR